MPLYKEPVEINLNQMRTGLTRVLQEYPYLSFAVVNDTTSAVLGYKLQDPSDVLMLIGLIPSDHKIKLVCQNRGDTQDYMWIYNDTHPDCRKISCSSGVFEMDKYGWFDLR